MSRTTASQQLGDLVSASCRWRMHGTESHSAASRSNGDTRRSKSTFAWTNWHFPMEERPRRFAHRVAHIKTKSILGHGATRACKCTQTIERRSIYVTIRPSPRAVCKKSVVVWETALAPSLQSRSTTRTLCRWASLGRRRIAVYQGTNSRLLGAYRSTSFLPVIENG